jgi:hypothetical protein
MLTCLKGKLTAQTAEKIIHYHILFFNVKLPCAEIYFIYVQIQ